MFIPSARTAGQFAAVLLCTFAFVAAGQDKKSSEQPAQTPVLSPNETVAVTAVETPDSLLGSDLDQVASGFAGSTGKMAVIKRLEALFKGSAKPIVQTKPFDPAPPYIAMHEIPAKDELTPARMIIVYRLRFVNAKKAQDAIEGIVGESGTVEVSENQNSVIINTEKDKADAIRGALLSLDQPQPQILVEAQIIEVQLEQGEERDVQLQYSQYDAKTGTTDTYGFRLDSPGQKNNADQSSGFDFFPISSKDSSGNTKKLQAALKWLSTSTDAKVLASPNIIADLGSEAKMTTGEELPYMETAMTSAGVAQNIKFKKTGVNLRIKPVIINKDTVRLEIKPEIILAVRYQTFTQKDSEGNVTSESGIPVVSVRNIETTLTAADGEIIMLGGLYSSEATERLRKTPILSELPVIGDLFTAKDATIYDKQLLFFMKIHILQSPYSVLLDPETTAAQIQDIGRAVRDSGTLFREKSKPEVKDQETLFKIDSLWNPEPVILKNLGNEAGMEKRVPPRPLSNQQPVILKKDSGASGKLSPENAVSGNGAKVEKNGQK